MKVNVSNKNWILLSTTILIAIAFSVYFLVYVKGSERTIISNNFRVLDQIVQNIKSLEKSYIKNAGSSLSVTNVVNGKIVFNKDADVNRKLSPILEKEFYQQENEDTLLQSIYYGKHGMYFQDQEQDTIKNIVFRIDYDTFFNNKLVLREDIFDQMLIIKIDSIENKKMLKKKILYSNGRLGVMDSAFNYSTTIKAKNDVTINDTEYISFNQEIDENGGLLISGLVLKSNFNQQKRSVSPFMVSFLTIMLILIILAIPLLKLQIMSLEERLHIKDVVFSVVSLLIGPSVFIIFFYTLITFIDGNLVPKKINKNLKTLSERVESRFGDELDNMLKQAIFLDTTFRIKDTANFLRYKRSDSSLFLEIDTAKLQKSFGPTKGFPRKNYSKQEFYVYQSVLDSFQFLPYYRHLKSAFWADKEGNSRVVLSAYKVPSYGQKLSHRKYLMNIVHNQPTRFKGPDNEYDIVVESIKSVNDGSYEVGVGIGTKCPDGLLPVFATSSKMNSLYDVVLEEGFGFCIMDREGNTLFHSDKYKNLNENFIEETNGAFKYSLLSNTSQLRTTDYNGKRQVVLLRPMNNLEDHYIATFLNTQVFYSPFTLSVISSFLFFLSYLTTILLCYLIMFVVTYRPTKLKQLVYIFNFLKPFETSLHLSKYKTTVWLLCSVLVYFLITVFWNYKSHDFVISELFFISIAVLLSIFIYLAKILPEEEIIHTVFYKPHRKGIIGFGSFILFFFLIRLIFLITKTDNLSVIFNGVFGLGIVIFIVFKLLFSDNDALAEQRVLKNLNQVRKLHQYFKYYLFLLVILYSVIPINLFLRISSYKENEVFAKYRSLDLLERVEDWEKINMAEFSGKFSEVGDSLFMNSMAWNSSYIYQIEDSIRTFNCKIDSLNKFFESSPVKTICNENHEGEYLKTTKSDTIFNGIYKLIRPNYNLRSELTSNYMDNMSSNSNWLFHSDKQSNIVSKIVFNVDSLKERKEASISMAKVGKHNFFSDYWAAILLVFVISALILFTFLNFILNKIFGFKYKDYASKVQEINSDNFPDLFLNDEKFSNKSSYNNLFIVGVNLEHKNFIRDYFIDKSDKELYVLNMDDFFEVKQESTDSFKSFRDIVKVNQFKKNGTLIERGWQEIEAYYDHAKKPAYILIEHFEFGYNDVLVNRMKIQLLKYLVDCEKFKVIIKSEINATKLLDYYGDTLKRIEKLLKDKNVSDRIALMKMFDEFKVDYKKWQHLLGSFVKCVVPVNNQLSEDPELRHGEFLNMLENYLEGTTISELPFDDRVLSIQQMSYPYYFSIWNSLSKGERYIVYDIAKDRFVNTVNTNGIISLLNKGILVYDHSLRLMNESFTNFVLTTVSSDEALEMEMESRKKGTWNTAFGVIILLIISLVIFLSIGQQNFLNDINAFLTSIAALIGLLIRFSGFLTFGSKVSGG